MWLISLVAVVLCSYFLAKMTANLVALQFDGTETSGVLKVPRLGADKGGGEVASFDDFKVIVERNIFDSREVNDTTEPVVKDEVYCKEHADDPECGGGSSDAPTGEAQPTSLGIKLVSTFSVGDGTDKRSSCIITGGGGNKKGDAPAETVFAVGDSNGFAPDTKVVKILFDRVEFTNKGRLEYVLLENFAEGASMNVPPQKVDATKKSTADSATGPTVGIEETGEGKFVIDRAEIDSALSRLDQLYTEIRAVPHFKGGKPNGLKLLSVKAESLFGKLGLKRGDILQRINGMELDIKKGLEIFNQLKTETNLTIDLERRGSVVTQEYEIR